MKSTLIGLLLTVVSVHFAVAQNGEAEQEIINLSKAKWEWMAGKNVDELSKFFHEKAVFVHMGGSWGTEQELNIIQSGGIWYK
ncbi:MAG TPA: nuclear transport factor 2 family protein, partial [Proteiniphilum sp.]|nr:nuclear transport factor 2 family protein [Proteiniphilum sp.]